MSMTVFLVAIFLAHVVAVPWTAYAIRGLRRGDTWFPALCIVTAAWQVAFCAVMLAHYGWDK